MTTGNTSLQSLSRHLVLPNGRICHDRIARHLGPLLVRIATRYLRDESDAEDLVQEVLLRVVSRPDALPTSPAHLVSWMIRLTRSRCIDRLRAEAVRRKSDERIRGERVEHHDEEPVDVLAVAHLHGALVVLRQEERDVVDLVYFRGHTQQEVARKLTIPLGTVKTRQRLALDRLRRELAHIAA
ncbi:MAG: sigma-70 family RNA polymerase sigma factor [Gemmatimonadales bacterium]|nr:sigma-70 family RNA polymerase sigma factor [Gemmatimonadales bacterium]